MRKLFIAFLTLISGLTQAQDTVDFSCIAPSEVVVNWILNGETTSESVVVATGDNLIPVEFKLPTGLFANPNFSVTSSQTSYYTKVNVSASTGDAVIKGKLVIDSHSPGGDLGAIDIDLNGTVYSEKVDLAFSTFLIDTDPNVTIGTTLNTFYDSMVGESNSIVLEFDIPDNYRLIKAYSTMGWAGVPGFQYRFLETSADDYKFSIEVYATSDKFGESTNISLPVDAIIEEVVIDTAIITVIWNVGNEVSKTVTHTFVQGEQDWAWLTYDLPEHLIGGPDGTEIVFYGTQTPPAKMEFGQEADVKILQGKIQLPHNFEYKDDTITVNMILGDHVVNDN